MKNLQKKYNRSILYLVIGFVFFLTGILLIIKSNQKYGCQIRIDPTPTPTNTPTPTPTPNKAKASFYTNEYCERYNPACITASGDKFDDSLYTCACINSIPLGTQIKFIYQERSIIATCNDRGSFKEKYNRAFDLSKATFLALAPITKGVIELEYEIIN